MILSDRKHAHKHVKRAQIVLRSANCPSALSVANRASVRRPAVWRWAHRLAEEGVERLLSG